MILTPEYIFKTIECIRPDFLAAHGIKALVLDVDNTLTADNSQVLEPTVQAWLDEMRAAGIRLTIVSNNTAKRVRPFAERIGLDWVPLACKPFTIGLRVARRRAGPGVRSAVNWTKNINFPAKKSEQDLQNCFSSCKI